jgi:N6-L-threonylcarbamoyladenine synthase
MGIESSCDETAVAIIDGQRKILAHRLVTQMDEHSPYGGVVPEIASRAHLAGIDVLIRDALREAGVAAEGIDLFAAGAGPGLIGGLIVGLNAAKAMAFALGRPFVAINHLEAHALMPQFFEPVEFPYLLLLVSGGHTQILRVEGVGQYRMLGATLDDACGECFDKCAKMLGYGYMGGKSIERAARNGDPDAYAFPRPLLNSRDLDFSFSGLKTAVRTEIEKIGTGMNEKIRADICAGLQAAICDVIGKKIRSALSANEGVKCLVASGGAAGNGKIRAALEKAAGEKGLELKIAPPEYCTDNGVMIAYAGQREFEERGPSPMDFAPRPRWPLEDLRGGGWKRN